MPTCKDAVQNGTETGLDCGGKCDACDNGRGCWVDADCTSGHRTEGVCVAPRCTDGVQNGTESDKDCRGGTDCESGMCLMGLCVPAMKTGKALSREGWHASASNSYPGPNTPDGVLDSVGGRWTSNANRYVGMWFEVDMGEPQAFFEIEFTSTEAPADAPGEFELSCHGAVQVRRRRRPSKLGGPISIYSFYTARVARYFKIVLRQADAHHWWSSNEINVRK